jgi:hypothetical protein
MAPKRFSFKTARARVIGGVVIGGVVGVVAAIRELTRPRHSTDVVEQATGGAQAETGDAADRAVTGEPSAGPAADGHDHAAPATQPRPGWQMLAHEPLPRPTYWPAVLALGIVFLAWGIVTSFLISAVGGILLVIALVGWIGELRHGH